MGNFHITSLTDVSCPIVLHPEWTFRDHEVLIRSEQRTQEGKGFVYRWGSYFKYELPVAFVSSADQALLNSWWNTQEDVAFTLDTSANLSTILCRVANSERPIDRFLRPYVDLYAGKLELESLDGSPKIPQPFVLDDEVLGLLNKNFNALIR